MYCFSSICLRWGGGTGVGVDTTVGVGAGAKVAVGFVDTADVASDCGVAVASTATLTILAVGRAPESIVA